MAHHGLDLSEECKSKWAVLVEKKCHEDFKHFFIQMYMVEPNINNIIRMYQSVRGYTEEDWPLESLYKIVTRMNITSQIKKSREEFLKKYIVFFTANMSERSDTSKNTKNTSEPCN